MKNGLYQVTTNYLCAAFYIKNNEIKMIAPILKNKIDYWKTIAIKIEEK